MADILLAESNIITALVGFNRETDQWVTVFNYSNYQYNTDQVLIIKYISFRPTSTVQSSSLVYT